MGRMRLTTDEQGRVTLSYDEEWCGETRRVTRTFVCREEGGYVWERDDAGNRRQPCERLASTGSTLHCSGRDRLPEVIRREYRAMRRAERAEARV